MLKSVTSMFDMISGGTNRKLRRARMIACDLDGTLLNRDDIISPTTTAMIRKVIDLGIPFVISTARHHQAVEPFADELRINQPIISLDGAVITYPDTGEPLGTITFDQDFALDILEEILQTPGVEFCAVTPNCFYTSNQNAPLPSRYEHWNIERATVDSVMEIKGPILEVIGVGDFYTTNNVFTYVDSRMKRGELKIRLYESQSRGDNWFLEIRSPRATKLHALEQLIAPLGISLKEVIGIGDNRNDLDFCGKAGYVVAVQNAVKELKEMADFITARECTEEGINEFFEIYLRAHNIDPAAIVPDQQRPGQSRRRSR
jgi:Cof subfamily protein (haloacid dehalogenase superfamily)